MPGWDVPWVLTNPIYVFDEAAAAAAGPRRVGRPPSRPLRPRPQTIDAFEGGTRLRAGLRHVVQAWSAPSSIPTAGPDGQGAARLASVWAVRPRDHPDVFARSWTGTPRDLTGRQGLVFCHSRRRRVPPLGAGPRREPGLAPTRGPSGGSLRCGRRPSGVGSPFRSRACARSTPHTDGQLDLDKVRALVFVLDKGAVKPGTAGTIWIDELGLY